MKQRWIFIIIVSLFFIGTAEGKKKKFDPFDLYDHEMHNGFYEMASFACETCHINENAFTRETVNRLGCHQCHNNPNPPAPAEQDCSRCHPNGQFPKPKSHNAGWLKQHRIHAKADPKSCATCHSDSMFCIDCHQRRDKIQNRVHPRSFRQFHSIEARATPQKCDSCHVVQFCTNCHQGKVQ